MNKENKRISNLSFIDNILMISTKKRKRLMNDCRSHSASNANGDWWYNEDTNIFEGDRAIQEKRRQVSIIKRIKEFCGTDEIPQELTWQGDPRGFTLYLNIEDLTDKQKELCDDYKLSRDWGGNFAILTDREL